MNSHVSYHKNGNIWRTAPYPIGLKKIGKYYPLNKFREMFQFGTCMILKSQLKSNPPLKETHRKKALAIQEVDLKVYPSDIMNIVVEFFEPGELLSLLSKDFPPPLNTTTFAIDCIEPWVVLTLFGHKDNLLIKPIEDGFSVSHFNNRYSTNRKGVKYQFEAYG